MVWISFGLWKNKAYDILEGLGYQHMSILWLVKTKFGVTSRKSLKEKYGIFGRFPDTVLVWKNEDELKQICILLSDLLHLCEEGKIWSNRRGVDLLDIISCPTDEKGWCYGFWRQSSVLSYYSIDKVMTRIIKEKFNIEV